MSLGLPYTAENRLKIVHVIFSFTTGGAESMLIDIANEQSNIAAVDLVVINDRVEEPLLERLDKRVTHHLLGRKEGSRNPAAFVKLNTLLFFGRFDAVHCHNEQLARAIIINRSRTMVTIHGVGQTTRGLNLYGRLFAISEAVQRDIFDRTGLPSKVVYNGIYCDRIKQRDRRSVKAGEEIRLVQIGRLRHQEKGQHILLRGLKQLSRLYGIENIKVDFIGGGESLKYLNHEAKELGLVDRVRFLGLMDRETIYQRLSEYHALIQPSISEGFGLTVAEGMAARIPVIVSDVNGPMEIIDKGNCGLHFKVGDSEDCARAMKTLVMEYNSERIEKMIQGALKRVQDTFNIRDTARKYCDDYILNRTKGNAV